MFYENVLAASLSIYLSEQIRNQTPSSLYLGVGLLGSELTLGPRRIVGMLQQNQTPMVRRGMFASRQCGLSVHSMASQSVAIMVARFYLELNIWSS